MRSSHRPRVLRDAVRVVLLTVAAFGPMQWTSSAWPADPPLNAQQRTLVKRTETARIEAIAKVQGTVVSIFGNDRSEGGSGVLFDPAGLALTNHHVVAGAGFEGWAGLADGQLYRWRTMGTDPGGDIALIQLDRSKPFPFALLGDSDQVQLGDWAMAMGNPFLLAEDYHPTVTLGIVSGMERYQPGGGGKNQLIYGNCIQVDSSINPGNSGGPLFNLRGQVIGINGRGSFKERGRVNVGLGYAVSTRQIRNFIPDLLATKIAQHGTLNALFTNRGGRVVCSTLDLDSPVAQEGLQLGDELVSLEGESIIDANQFTNLITTLPARWPVRLVYRRSGHETSILLRLTPLPYTLAKPEEPEGAPPKPKDGPHVRAATAAGAEAPRGSSLAASSSLKDKLKKPPKAPTPEPPDQRKTALLQAWNVAQAGIIRNVPLNHANAARVLARWANTTGVEHPPARVKAFRIEQEVRNGDDVVAKDRLLLSFDGRFRMDIAVGQVAEAEGFDGDHFWHRIDGRTVPSSLRDAIDHPQGVQAFVLAASLNPNVLARHGTVTIDGSDRIGPRSAYRLRLQSKDGAVLFLWLSIDVDGNVQQHDLLAAGTQLDPSGGVRQVLFGDTQTLDGISLPQHFSIVRDSSRRTENEVFVKRCASEASIPTDAFRSSSDVAK